MEVTLPGSIKATVQCGQVCLLLLSRRAAGYLVSHKAFGLRPCLIQCYLPLFAILSVQFLPQTLGSIDIFETGSHVVAQAGLK